MAALRLHDERGALNAQRDLAPKLGKPMRRQELSINHLKMLEMRTQPKAVDNNYRDLRP
jgi:hypothetical protein